MAADMPDEDGLEVDEGFPGAHTIGEHVGKTFDELLLRLASNPGLKRASSFRNLEDAESGVSQVISGCAAEVETWLSDAGEGAKMAFELPVTSVHGLSVARNGAAIEVTGVRVVLKKIVTVNRAYYVLTAFPF